MNIPNNYNDILKLFDNTLIVNNGKPVNPYYVASGAPNYIPVKNEADFTYDIYAYYNQYYASPYVTQKRRLLRNYFSNNQTIKESNKNPFLNNQGKKFNFLYTYDQSYMIVQTNTTTDLYILINKNWCKMKTFNNSTECDYFTNFIKKNALKTY